VFCVAAKIKRWWNKLLAWLFPLKREQPGLLEAVEEAKRAWKQALHDLHFIDQSFIDYTVYNINAAERRYVALLKQAQREEVTAWPACLCYPGAPATAGAGPAEKSMQREGTVNC